MSLKEAKLSKNCLKGNKNLILIKFNIEATDDLFRIILKREKF